VQDSCRIAKLSYSHVKIIKPTEKYLAALSVVWCCCNANWHLILLHNATNATLNPEIYKYYHFRFNWSDGRFAVRWYSRQDYQRVFSLPHGLIVYKMWTLLALFGANKLLLLLLLPKNIFLRWIIRVVQKLDNGTKSNISTQADAILS